MRNNIAGAILAGGNNLRMKGRNKSFLKINGTPLIQKTISLFKRLFEEIIIVTNCPPDYALYKKDALIVTDILKNKGPLGGIHTGLTRATKKRVFFAACDMPFLEEGLIKRILDISEDSEGYAVIPYVEPTASSGQTCRGFPSVAGQRIYKVLRIPKGQTQNPSPPKPTISPFAKGGLKGDLKEKGEKAKSPHEQAGLQPLCAVYPKKALPAIEKALSEERLAIRDFLKDFPGKLVNVNNNQAHAFYNINTPEDFRYASSRAKFFS
ncbi:MAG: molybdenum cofactor guanylyltransferase [Desulfobacterales bacterium]|nr:molybdenum cofactor guanylyltransferase [Desulfobacterales bacterium]